MPMPIFCLPLTPAYPPWISYQAMIHIELCMNCFNFSSVSIDIVFVHVVWGKFCKICRKEKSYVNTGRWTAGAIQRIELGIAKTAIPRCALRFQKEKASAGNKFPPRLSAFCRTARSRIATILK